MLLNTSRSEWTQGSSARRLRISSSLSASHDQQCAHATAFAAGERSGEEQEALVGEVVHERGVIGHGGLVGDPAVGPARACFADDGVGAHRARAIRERYVFWRR